MKIQTAVIAKFASFALVAGAFVPTAAHAQASAVQPVASGNAWDYNLYSFGNASNSNTNTDISGRVAIGGNGTFNNFTLASQETGSTTISNSNVNVVIGGNYTNNVTTTSGTVDVGGNVNLTDPTINGGLHANGNVTLGSNGNVYGNVTYGTGKTYTNPNTGVSGTVSSANTTLPLDFTAQDNSLVAVSSTLASLTGSSNVAVSSSSTYASDGTGFSYTNAYGSGTLTYNGSKSTAVFTITADQFNAAQYGFTINAGSAQSVIINVTGGSAISLNNGQMNLNGLSADQLLFNFTNATSITQGAFGMQGSILATNAAYYGNGGSMNGSLIVNSFSDSGTEVHNYLYTGYLPTAAAAPAAVPEPGMYVTALSLAGTMGAALLRGRRKMVA